MKTEIEKYRPCGDALDFRKKYNTFQEAWEACPRGDWMLWLAHKTKVDIRPLTLAKALCAETVAHLMEDKRSLRAVGVAKDFGLGVATKEELYDAAAATAAAHAAAAAAAAHAAAAAAAAAYAAVDAAYYAAAAAAAAAAAYAAAAADAKYYAYAKSAKAENQLKTANICREVLTKEVFEKLGI